MLPSGAYALLGRYRPCIVSLLFSQKHAFELHHACIREQERRIVSWHEGRTGNDFVPLLRKKVQEKLS